MREAHLPGIKTLFLMLLICIILTGEEAVHLARSHPNETTDSRTVAFHPGCTPLDPTGRILRCPVRGYGGMNFLCSQAGCLAKELSNGLFITAAESKLLDMHFKAVNQGQTQ